MKKYTDQQVLDALKQEGTINGAARLLGLNQRSLRRRLKRLGAAEEVPPPVPPAPPKPLPVEQEHQLIKQNRFLGAEIKRLKQEIAEDRQLAQFLDQVKQVPPSKPLKLQRSPKKKPLVAATAFLSDCHFDEVVRPDEVGGVNVYDRAIAEHRLQQFAEKTVLMSHNFMSEFTVRHLDLPLGGDMVSGNIHDELARSNEDEIMGTVMHWATKLAEMVIALAKEFETIHAPAVVGNHGRNTKKPRHKGKVRDNFDWLIYQWVKALVQQAGVKNVSFQISTTSDVVWETEGFRYLMTHGDQAKGGSGWGGLFSPIMRLYEHKLKREAGFGRRFDYMILGHWHQFKDLNRVIINGSLKGYDEFANDHNFEPEAPQQAFWLTDRRHGKILSAPLFVDGTPR